MQKRLFFICPTDFLEPVIDGTFNQAHYFCSSLGNSISFDANELEQIKNLITANRIREISFVLSNDNQIVLDALGNREFSEISGLNHFYSTINQKRKHAKVSWQTLNRERLILSYYLNDKIKELKSGLHDLSGDHLTISGKIYHRQKNTFIDIYSDLICLNYYKLN